ncbi:MAG: matrixin family metalloprotease [Xanthomonadaceae bacterium]|nr:matrixin family metalloprotease [Xanthomonadaceae bacterium]
MMLFLLLSVLNSQAFTLISTGNVGWQTSTLTFNVDTTCNNYLGAVNAAMNSAISLWTNAPTANLTLAIGSTVTFSGTLSQYVGTSATLVAPAGNPTIICSTTFSTDTGIAANSGIPGVAGAFNISSGRIQGGLLVLNVQSGDNANITTMNSTVVAVIVAHEMGHILGLGHSGDTSALMYYDASAKNVLSLGQDDVDGISFLYPRQEPRDKVFGCATIENINSGSGGGTSLPLLFEFVLLLTIIRLGIRNAKT